MNKLFNKLVSVIKGQTNSPSGTIPFAVGRIYSASYRNFKHDPKPLLLIIGSDSYYTVAINIHYIPGFPLENWIIQMRQSQKVLTGKIIYDVLKMRLPMVPKLAYRKYFTSMLHGKFVSSGLYTGPEQTAFQFAVDPFVKRLNNKITSFAKNKAVPPNSQELQSIRSQINSAYNTNSQQPFAAKTTGTVGTRPATIQGQQNAGI
jgi:hypothetical protein